MRKGEGEQCEDMHSNPLPVCEPSIAPILDNSICNESPRPVRKKQTPVYLNDYVLSIKRGYVVLATTFVCLETLQCQMSVGLGGSLRELLQVRWNL